METETEVFKQRVSQTPEVDAEKVLSRKRPTTLQVNLGDLCNQACAHCHHAASPAGENVMEPRQAGQVLEFLAANDMEKLDLTGGAPELNPVFEGLVREGKELVDELLVRTNLTVQHEPELSYLPEFYAEHGVHLVASLPCYTRENVADQRGRGVFEKSLRTLKELNRLGYGETEALTVDLVYNPAGTFLPPDQAELEADYRERLRSEHGIEFDNLLTLANVPLGRYRKELREQDEFEAYLELLRENFNPEVLEELMCRSLISVGPRGYVYACDFNQALDLRLKLAGEPVKLAETDASTLAGTRITTGEHCLACAAGSGSSCGGALTD